LKTLPPPERRPHEHGRTAMRTFWMNLRYWSGDYRVLAGLALLAAGAVAYFGKEGVLAAGGWLLAAAVLGLLAWLLVMVVRRFRARRAGAGLDAMVAEQGEQEVASAEPASRAQAEALRERMAAAVQAIRTSRIGQARGTAAGSEERRGG